MQARSSSQEDLRDTFGNTDNTTLRIPHSSLSKLEVGEFGYALASQHVGAMGAQASDQV